MAEAKFKNRIRFKKKSDLRFKEKENPVFLDILSYPIITEKSEMAQTNDPMLKKKVCFQVPQWANKVMIAAAVENVFKTKVEKVNVNNRPGKEKFFRGNWGKKSDRKYAMITLTEPVVDFWDRI